MTTKNFTEQYPDMAGIVEMYEIGCQMMFGGFCQFEIALTSEEESNLTNRYEEQGYTLADVSYLGDLKENIQASFMTFTDKEE